MATILQTQLLTFLTPIFIFLLIFVIIFALLQKVKIFGANKGFDAVVAFSVGFLFMITPEATQVITLFTPWVLLLGLLAMVIFIFFMFLGVSSESMVAVAKDSTFVTFSVIFIVILFLITLSQAFGPFLVATPEAGFWNTTKRVIFHPRMLGALFILAVSAYAVRFISASQ